MAVIAKCLIIVRFYCVKHEDEAMKSQTNSGQYDELCNAYTTDVQSCTSINTTKREAQNVQVNKIEIAQSVKKKEK